MDQIKKWVPEEPVKNVTAWAIPGLPNKSLTKTEDLQRVLKDLAHVYGYSYEELIGKSRKAELVFIRQMFCFYIRPRCTFTLYEIGTLIGRADHSTVIHSIESFQAELDTDNTVPWRLIERGSERKVRTEYLRILKTLNKCL